MSRPRNERQTIQVSYDGYRRNIDSGEYKINNNVMVGKEKSRGKSWARQISQPRLGLGDLSGCGKPSDSISHFKVKRRIYSRCMCKSSIKFSSSELIKLFARSLSICLISSPSVSCHADGCPEKQANDLKPKYTASSYQSVIKKTNKMKIVLQPWFVGGKRNGETKEGKKNTPAD